MNGPLKDVCPAISKKAKKIQIFCLFIISQSRISPSSEGVVRSTIPFFRSKKSVEDVCAGLQLDSSGSDDISNPVCCFTTFGNFEIFRIPGHASFKKY